MTDAQSAPIAMITGAAGNLGRAVADHFRSQGYRLVLVDLQASALAQHHGQDNDRQRLVAVDLLDTGKLETAVASVVDTFGRIDVLCNVAGGFRMGPAVHETSDGDWDFLFGLNARTVVNTARAVVPRMLAAGRGKIVNVAAYGALRGGAQMSTYAASKSAVIRLTESMSAELRERGINVNCVLPTIIDTPENRAAMPGADASRWVSPQDLAKVIGFLASDDARAVHGAAVPVSGLS